MIHGRDRAPCRDRSSRSCAQLGLASIPARGALQQALLQAGRRALWPAERREPSGCDEAVWTIDSAIVNRLQGGFPLVERPFAAVAAELGIAEDDLIARLQRARWTRASLTRFGPMYRRRAHWAARSRLAAMRVPRAGFRPRRGDRQRAPGGRAQLRARAPFNMWFVVATERPEGIARDRSRRSSGDRLPVLDLPKRAASTSSTSGLTA